MTQHRAVVHDYVDPAVCRWRERRGECPFCFCFFREGAGQSTSFGHFTAEPDPSAVECHRAYLAWEASGAPLPRERTVRPTVRQAHTALLIAISDLESDASLRRRVKTWSAAQPVGGTRRRTAGLPPSYSGHAFDFSRR